MINGEKTTHKESYVRSHRFKVSKTSRNSTRDFTRRQILDHEDAILCSEASLCPNANIMSQTISNYNMNNKSNSVKTWDAQSKKKYII